MKDFTKLIIWIVIVAVVCFLVGTAWSFVYGGDDGYSGDSYLYFLFVILLFPVAYFVPCDEK